MSLFEAVIRALLFIFGCALVFYLVIWALGVAGIVLPFMVERIIMGMLVLFAILVLVRLFYPWMSSVRLFPPRDPPPG